MWPGSLQRKGRVATRLNDNSPDDSNDNPPAIPADCREPTLCSPLPLLVWWSFILIWMDHQLDKEKSARPRTSVKEKLSMESKMCTSMGADTCMYVHTYTHCLSNKDTTIGKCPQVNLVTCLGCSYYLLGTCSRGGSPNIQPQLRLSDGRPRGLKWRGGFKRHRDWDRCCSLGACCFRSRRNISISIDKLDSLWHWEFHINKVILCSFETMCVANLTQQQTR